MAKHRQRRTRKNRIVEGHPIWNQIVQDQSVPPSRLPNELSERPVMCPLCDELWPRHLARNMTIDHVAPLAKGGPDIRSNMQLVCPPCNAIKSKLEQQEARRRCIIARHMGLYEYGLWKTNTDAKEYNRKKKESEIMRRSIREFIRQYKLE